MNITDALTIRRIAERIGCTATIATTADALRDDREAADVADMLRRIPSAEYPDSLRKARRAAFVSQLREQQESSDGLWKR